MRIVLNLLLSASLFFLLSTMIFAQIAGPGDIAFTGFNADGDDDFAIVLLKDVTNQTIYFTDNESDGDGGLVDSNEGALQWDSGASMIPAGTIVIFTDTDNPTNPNFGASHGTLSMPDGTMNLNSTGDGILAFLGTNETSPTTFIAGIENDEGAAGDLDGTNLVEGTHFLNFSAGSSDDGGEYTGSRSSETDFADYLTLINNSSSWTTSTGDGESLLPLDDTDFTESSAPVVLLSFEGKSINDEFVQLSWKTESEVNNNYFMIQHSLDGSKYNDLAKVAGYGTTNLSQDYKFLHKEPFNGKNFYRLKQMDFNGASEIFNSLIVELKALKLTSEIYPTFASDFITIRSSGKLSEKVSRIDIYSLGGGLVSSKKLQLEEEIYLDLTAFQKGAYLVRITTAGKSQVSRFFVN